MHSPAFATGNYPSQADNFRYPQDHLDIQHAAAGMITPQYDYGHNLSAQQPPTLDTSLELPNSTARIPFALHYSIESPTKMDFHNPSQTSSRITAGVPSKDFRYSPASSSVRRFPDNHSPGLTTHIESPLTASSSSSKTVRKQITGVVIARRQTRARKIRCDSTRPVCDNCSRRTHDCEYDEKPRRRGPDKRPGTRQRFCKKRHTDGYAPPPKRQRAATKRLSEKDEDLQSNALESQPSSGTAERYSPKFYLSTIRPAAAHARPSISAGDLQSSEPNSYLKHELAPRHRRPSSYVYNQGPYNSCTTQSKAAPCPLSPQSDGCVYASMNQGSYNSTQTVES